MKTRPRQRKQRMKLRQQSRIAKRRRGEEAVEITEILRQGIVTERIGEAARAK